LNTIKKRQAKNNKGSKLAKKIKKIPSKETPPSAFVDKYHKSVGNFDIEKRTKLIRDTPQVWF